MSDSRYFYEVVLIGDTGSPLIKTVDPVLDLLRHKLPSSSEASLVFLGDNIYPKGMPPKGHALRKVSEAKLIKQLEATDKFKGRLIFLSGNHDWNRGKKNGYEYLLRQEEFIKSYLNQSVYHPSGGCPGPEEMNVTDYLTIIAINTQWWVQRGFRPIGEEYGCSVNSEAEFFDKLLHVLTKNQNKRILVLGHLPLYSYAMHAGKYLLKHHMFPLTIYKKKAYVPFPILGSLLPMYRKYIGSKDDMVHPRYKRFRKKIKEIFKKFPELIYASGHDHILQYIKRENNHFIISGTGSKVSYVKKGRYALFSNAEKGFFKLRFNDDKTVDMEVWEVMKGTLTEKLAFQKRIIE